MPVDFTMGPAGLASLTWNGQEFLFAGGNAPFVVEAFATDNMRGSAYLNPNPLSTVTNTDAVTQTYEWGEITTQYSAEGDSLRIGITIRNDWHTTLYRYRLYPLALQYPQPPTNTGNIATFNVDGPSSLFLDYTTGTLDLVNEDPAGPLGIGFWQATSPPATQWFVQVFADPGQNINPNWPSVMRPVEPGQSLSFTVAVRFGGAGATEEDLAGDIYAQYRAAYPRILRSAPLPKKPVARLSFNGAFRPSFAKNPRGWFNDASLDVTTPEGIAAFQSRLLGAADASVKEMSRVGASGGVIWDIEGQQLAQSYIGDPAQAEILAPEIIGIVDQFVAKIRNAGFRVGFTLRPQQFTVASGLLSVDGVNVAWVSGAPFQTWWPNDRAGGLIAFGVDNYGIVSVSGDGKSMVIGRDAGQATGIPFFYARQVNTLISPSPYEVMQQSVQYCLSRWGATLFYVDTDITYAGNITASEDFERLRNQYPDVYIFPEWKGARHYSATYPWTDSMNGYIFPNKSTLLTYPDAAGLIRVPGDGEIDAVAADLTEAVRAGSILLFDGWYPHPANDVVIQIYKDAAAG
jgi:hypothetical protein